MFTDFSQIIFEPEQHRYFLAGRELTGVTKRLKDVVKPFDREAVAAKVATREGKSIHTVLWEWEQKGEKGRQLGTAVHKYIQDCLIGKGNNGQMSLDPFLSLNTKLPEQMAFDDLWRQVSPKVNVDRVHVEWIIGDADMELAGTVDTMLFSKETGKHHIWDWKTGKFETANQWAKLLPPFDSLDDCELNRYSLQVSLYRLIIERNTNLPLADSYLVHLTPKGFDIYRAVDFREAIVDWLDLPPF